MPDGVTNALTVDVEDWFHATFLGVPESSWSECESRVVDNTERLLEILADRGVRATFFVLGWVAERSPGLVRRIADGGHEIASHGQMHRQVHKLSRSEFTEDVRRSLANIQKDVDVPVLGYRAPAFSIGARELWALEILADLGFIYDSSVFPIRTPLYGIQGANRFIHRLNGGRIYEIPPATVSKWRLRFPISGGVYLRLLPMPFLNRAITWLNHAEHQPAVLYLHPWELDPQPPDRGRNALACWSHSVNKRGMVARLHHLLDRFAFAPIREVFDFHI